MVLRLDTQPLWPPAHLHGRLRAPLRRMPHRSHVRGPRVCRPGRPGRSVGGHHRVVWMFLRRLLLVRYGRQCAPWRAGPGTHGLAARAQPPLLPRGYLQDVRHPLRRHRPRVGGVRALLGRPRVLGRGRQRRRCGGGRGGAVAFVRAHGAGPGPAVHLRGPRPVVRGGHRPGVPRDPRAARVRVHAHAAPRAISDGHLPQQALHGHPAGLDPGPAGRDDGDHHALLLLHLHCAPRDDCGVSCRVHPRRRGRRVVRGLPRPGRSGSHGEERALPRMPVHLLVRHLRLDRPLHRHAHHRGRGGPAHLALHDHAHREAQRVAPLQRGERAHQHRLCHGG
mmetsp:Transcript_19487/g.52467  ORF Transcript_19487/g.52467 Transcript_19487/m.52467 type:complete len:336 (+) Transcript_19487:606-1613(+)